MKIIFKTLDMAMNWIKANVIGELEQEKVFLKILRQQRVCGEYFLHVSKYK